ncbi:MAG: SRPBCC domain-containing protein [Paracoccaceae bacterium]|nr:SRPBCC domain-containing protein [Paracoccaceae bacterium]
MKLYQAWLDPGVSAQFMTACEGQPAQRVEIGPRIGGKFLIEMPTPGGPVLHSGEFLELVPGKKIVFTWNSRHVNPGTHVVLTFDEVDGRTKVTLTHVKFATEAIRDNHVRGWTVILDNYVGAMA